MTKKEWKEHKERIDKFNRGAFSRIDKIMPYVFLVFLIGAAILFYIKPYLIIPWAVVVYLLGRVYQVKQEQKEEEFREELKVRK